MSLPRFFLDNQVLSDQVDEVFALRLDADDAKHAHVLRIGVGEHVAVIDATGDYFECEVVDASDTLFVRICTHEPVHESGPTLLLMQGLSKGDKFDRVVRQGTEVGVAAFVPLACTRSVVRLDAPKAAARVRRWRQIARSAAMQSGRWAVPEVAEVCDVDAAVGMLANATCVLVCWEQARAVGIKQALTQSLAATRTPACDARIALVVGPEGGLEQAEVDALLASNTQAYAVTLGPAILRTETAGVVAPALVLYELGVLQ